MAISSWLCGSWLVALSVLACSSSSKAGDTSDGGAAEDSAVCPSDLPATCPTPAPSYATDIAPILTNHCTFCHDATGVAGHDMTTYVLVYPQRSAILDQVYDCAMPAAGYPQLSIDQRVALLGWLVCNAPNN